MACDYKERKIDLKGEWGFALDKDKLGIEKRYFSESFSDSINLPSTVQESKKGEPSEVRHTGYLTDPYEYSGYAWFSKEIDFPQDFTNGEIFLHIERTRISHIWLDDEYVGTDDSLCASHIYNLTKHVTKGSHRLTILVDNSSLPVPGGHMTSPDTQTNWNGLLGELYIEHRSSVNISKIKVYADVEASSIKVKTSVNGNAKISAYVLDGEKTLVKKEYNIDETNNTFVYKLDETVKLWSEKTPNLYTLVIDVLADGEVVDRYTESFAFRDFKAGKTHFLINGEKTFLRGKHDGLIFPITGYAPMDLEKWLEVLTIAKNYGINHYRFHTCCPPHAAFTAADMLGIYMEPEVPFWGTITTSEDEGHDQIAQDYLVEEGYRMLDEFGNHPSFVMMSLGNELWGSKERLNEILGSYKKYDSRHLYTQGCNNFQFVPCVVENDDFYVGVRFSRDRLFRGSYAMCDAPQGHLQICPPDSSYNFDEMIRPKTDSNNVVEGGTVEIQYGTGVKTVSSDASDELVLDIPVISHEVGQYAMFPDFNEIEKYTGVLKARSFEVFRERLEQSGMIDKADDFFKASGRFAAECYKAEIETALRSSELAGFQILDLQDFTGQGTALVGILNSFMENKGVISEDEWRSFCAEKVLLGELDKFVFSTDEKIKMGIKLYNYSFENVKNPIVRLSASVDEVEVFNTEKEFIGEFKNGVFDLGEISIDLPTIKEPCEVKVVISTDGVKNFYSLWIFPEISEQISDSELIVDSLEKAKERLLNGENTIYFANDLSSDNTIEGTYCTDFWCFPMFRSISESMGRPIPIGTHGLLIDAEHSALKKFPTKNYSTPQWYDIVSNSSALKLDGFDINPIVQTIDNFERNHRLGLIFEVKIENAKLLVCTSNLIKLNDNIVANQLMSSLVSYAKSNDFNPQVSITMSELEKIVK